MAADGTRARPVTREPDRFTNSPAWSPDGQWIVVRRRLTDRSSLGTVELWMYSVLGGKGLQITKKEEWGDANEPLFSRDGRYVYFTGKPGRFAVQPATSTPGSGRSAASIASPARSRRSPTARAAPVAPEFSPDGRTMAFIRRIREKTVLHTYDLASGREHALWDGLSTTTRKGSPGPACTPPTLGRRTAARS